jgi:hypothetical protein
LLHHTLAHFWATASQLPVFHDHWFLWGEVVFRMPNTQLWIPGCLSMSGLSIQNYSTWVPLPAARPSQA